MAATQSTLQDFFKTKRNARDALEGKSKLDIVRSLETNSVRDETVSVEVSEQCTFTEVNLVPRKATIKPSARRVKTAVRNKVDANKSKAANKNGNIALAFQKVLSSETSESKSDNAENKQESYKSLKRGRDADDEENDGHTASAGDEHDAVGGGLQHNTTPTKTVAEVPAIVAEAEQQARKRPCRELKTSAKAAINLQESCVTPDAATRSAAAPLMSARTTRGSARKKLDMTNKTAEALSSVSAAPLQLKKCSKLSELRAQLRRVKECDNALQQFRARTEVAQQEAESAAALVTRSKGGLPEPRTFGSPSKSLLTRSPLKANSPRKMFSPHKSLSAPYPPPASPRRHPPHPQLEPFTSLAVEVPVSPCKTPIKSPVKMSSPVVGVPAYQRYQHLIQDTPTVAAGAEQSRELSLPYHYRVLREVFRAVDTVVSLMHNRQEVVTFSKLKPAVQQMLRKTFHERNLGQLSRVFPLGYIFRQDKIRPGASAIAASNAAGTPNKTGYQLTITANLDYKNSSSQSTTKVNLLSRFDSPSSLSQTSTATKSTLASLAATSSQKDNTFRKMDSLVLVDRRNTFHNGLIQALHKHHAAFLKSLVPSVEIPDPSSIKRWHPQFSLDEVPDIEPAPLPQPPHVQQYSNATDVLAAARGLFGNNPRMVAAVEKVAEKAVSAPAKESVTRPAPATPDNSIQKKLQQAPGVALALKGISMSLLEKIRAREAAAASRAMVRSSSATLQLAQLSRLPEVARILRHTILAERRGAVCWESVLTRLKESHSGMLSYGELEEHMELLLKEVPDWVTKHKLSSGVFIKINKNTDINNVVSRLETIIKERT